MSVKQVNKQGKQMRLKIKFGRETRFDIPIQSRLVIRSWTQVLPGTRLSLRSLAMAEQPKSRNRR